MVRQVYYLLVLALILASLTLIFVLQNPNDVTIRFINWQGQIPLALLLLMTLASGVMIGLICAVPTVFTKNTALSRQKRQNQELNQQLMNCQSHLENQDKRIKYLESHLNSRHFNPSAEDS